MNGVSNALAWNASLVNVLADVALHQWIPLAKKAHAAG